MNNRTLCGALAVVNHLPKACFCFPFLSEFGGQLSCWSPMGDPCCVFVCAALSSLSSLIRSSKSPYSHQPGRDDTSREARSRRHAHTARSHTHATPVRTHTRNQPNQTAQPALPQTRRAAIRSSQPSKVLRHEETQIGGNPETHERSADAGRGCAARGRSAAIARRATRNALVMRVCTARLHVRARRSYPHSWLPGGRCARGSRHWHQAE